MKKIFSKKTHNVLRDCTVLNREKTFKKIYELTCAHGDDAAASWVEDNVEKSLTYNELSTLTDNYASFLRNYFGTKGIVCISLDSCKEWFPLFWGLLRSGHDALLVDASFPDKMVEYLMGQAGCEKIVTKVPRALPPQCKQLLLSELLSAPDVKHYQPIWGKHVALCTSGTTNTSKIFVYDEEAIAYQILVSAKIFTEDRRIINNKTYKSLVFLPYHHILGFSALLIWSSFLGYTLVYPKDRSPKTILQTAQLCKINHLITVPVLVNNICNKIQTKVNKQNFFKRMIFNFLKGTSLCLQWLLGDTGTKFAQKVLFRSTENELFGTELKCLIVGGSHTPTRNLKLFNAIGYHTICGFGMTETAITSIDTSCKLHNRIKGSVGLPLQYSEYKVRGDAPSGELMIWGNGIHIGRLVDGKMQPREMQNGWYPTGDIVRIKENKKQVFIEGRIKDVIINESGENVYPDEIEDFFCKIDGIKQYSIIGLPKPNTDIHYEDITLIVNVAEHFYDQQFLTDLSRQLVLINHNLPGIKRITRAIATYENLPQVNGFKIKRIELKKLLENHALTYKELSLSTQLIEKEKDKRKKKDKENSEKLSQLSTSQDNAEIAQLRKTVLAIFGEVLEIPAEQIHPDAHFADELGGDSLQMLSVSNQVEEKYNLFIPTEKYPLCATANGMAQVVYDLLHGISASEDKALLQERTAITRFEDSPEYKQFKQREDALIADNDENPYFICHESPLLDTSVVNGREVLNFGSYNYVGMSGREEVKAAAKAAIDHYGTSASGSRLLAGEKRIHQQLEAAIAKWKHTESAIVCVGGHSTNVTFVGNFCGKNDLILYDALAHNSVEQGCRLSSAISKPFPHNNAAALEQILKTQRRYFEKILIIIEGAYSMDGDIADVPAFVALKKKYGCFLMVDEAHSACVIGATGGGVDEYFGLNPDDIDIKMGTLSKGLGTCGGYLAGKKELINYLRYSLPGFVFSVGISPALAAGALAAIRQLQDNPNIVANLHRNIQCFAEETKKRNLDLCLAGETAILPILVGKDEDAFRLSNELAHRGIIVPPAVYPAVPKNKARLRFCVISEHRPEQIVFALDELLQAAQTLNIKLPQRVYN